jgi:hypothetical protein
MCLLFILKRESHGGMILTGEDRRIRSKTCPSTTLSATNLLFHLVVLFTSMIGQCGEDDYITLHTFH